MPTFNFGFCRGVPFDRQHTPAEKMGPLAEYVRLRAGSVRSPHAIQSVAAVGASSAAVCGTNPPSAFDEDGPFGEMLRSGAKLMQLYLNYGSYGGRQLIARDAVEEFARYQYPQDSVRRGLGFDKPLLEYRAEDSYVARSASPASFGHSGYTGTFTWADPENGLLLVFFSNRVYPTRDNRRLYELEIRPRLHQACYDAIQGGGREQLERN